MRHVLTKERIMLARNEWITGYPTPPATIPHRVADTLRVWRRRIREREGLTKMTERDLRDARLTRADVQAEIAKPFWRA
ncbi:MAG: hypothetical protein ABI369_12165 [Acetobacteraceae bacterium]